MKTMIYLLAAGLTLSACSGGKATQKQTNSNSEQTNSISGKKWQLVALYGKPVANMINDKQPFIEFNQSTHRYNATAGCNGLGGSYSLPKKGKIKFTQGMSTMMFCNDMATEEQLNKVFSDADGYIVDNNTLTLYKSKTVVARFVAITDINLTILNGSWEVDFISGPRITFEGLYPNSKPTINFNTKEMIATGNSSCNNYRTSFTTTGNEIKFATPASTKMACEGAGEPTFFKMLSAVNKYSVTKNTLTLLIDDVVVMRLQKK